MTEIDRIAAARAALEMVTNENDKMLEHFKDLSEKLDALEKLPPGIKAVQFRQLERAGAFRFQGADIRHFIQSNKRPLTPSQFVQRTNRRLQNTNTLIEAFMKRDGFEGAKELKGKINSLTNEIVDQKDQKAVVEYKKRVEALRDTEDFGKYMKIKDKFIKEDDEIKAEAEIISAKETVADGEMMCETRGGELENIKKKMETGELSPEDAQQKVEEIEQAAEAASKGKEEENGKILED